MVKIFESVGIIGTGKHLPKKVLTNFDLEKIVDTSDEWIRSRTGISERRISDADTATSDLATAAAVKAMANAKVSVEEIDVIIVATATPDMAFPSTACIVQSNLGAKNAFAFDIQAACTGFIYGLSTGEKFISTGDAETVLVIGAETLTKICNWQDRNTCVLFGDGAGAAVLRKVEKGTGILASLLGAEGWKGEVLTLPAGGSRMPASMETLKSGKHFIHMDGGEVYKFAVNIMPKAVLGVLKKAGLTLKDVELIVPHQANRRIVESAAKKLKIHRDKIFVNLDKYGNMSSASIPVALDEALAQGLIKIGGNIVLVGFGAGLTWGSCVINWQG